MHYPTGFRIRIEISWRSQPYRRKDTYDVFAHSCPSFKDYFDLEFNMALYSTESVGYVLRVKGADEGQIFNLFFVFVAMTSCPSEPGGEVCVDSLACQ